MKLYDKTTKLDWELATIAYTGRYICFRNSFLKNNRVELRVCFTFLLLLYGLNSWKGDENVRHVRLYFNWHIIWVLLSQIEKKGLKSNLLKVHDRELRTNYFPRWTLLQLQSHTFWYLSHWIQNHPFSLWHAGTYMNNEHGDLSQQFLADKSKLFQPKRVRLCPPIT